MNHKEPSFEEYKKLLEENEVFKKFSDQFDKQYNEDESFRKMIDDWNSIGCQSFVRINFENGSEIATINGSESIRGDRSKDVLIVNED